MLVSILLKCVLKGSKTEQTKLVFFVSKNSVLIVSDLLTSTRRRVHMLLEARL